MGKLDENRHFVRNLQNIQNKINDIEDKINKLYSSSPKKGKCKLTKISKNPGAIQFGEKHYGYCPGIVVGYSCIIQGISPMYTSIVQSIDWNKGEFTTLNSKYKFEFYDNEPECS